MSLMTSKYPFMMLSGSLMLNALMNEDVSLAERLEKIDSTMPY